MAGPTRLCPAVFLSARTPDGAEDRNGAAAQAFWSGVADDGEWRHKASRVSIQRDAARSSGTSRSGSRPYYHDSFTVPVRFLD